MCNSQYYYSKGYSKKKKSMGVGMTGKFFDTPLLTYIFFSRTPLTYFIIMRWTPLPYVHIYGFRFYF